MALLSTEVRFAANLGGMSQNSYMTRHDVERPDLEQLDWSQERRADSVARVFAHALSVATSAEQWYAAKRRSKRWWGRALRVAAILLGGIAALLPILSEIYTTH